MTKDRAMVLVYTATVVLLTTVHRPILMGVVFLGASIIAGRDWMRVAKRVLRAVAVFNSVVTVSYVVVSAIRGNLSLEYLALMNIRVFVLTFVTILAGRRINIVRAVSCSRTLSYLITLALGHAAAFRRLLGDFRMAMASRMIRRPTIKVLYRHAASSASFFFLKALNDASEITDGMKSRGFFSD